MRAAGRNRERAFQPQTLGVSGRRSRAFLRAAIWLLPFLLHPADALGTKLLGVRTAPWDDRYRVVLDLAGKADYHAMVLTDPDRIAIDLPGIPAGDFPAPRVKDSRVKAVRINRQESGSTQVVLDLAGPPHYKIFTVPPGDGRGFRIVCDVLKTGAPAKPATPPGKTTAPEQATPAAPGTSSAPAARTAPVPPDQGPQPWVVVIDPGHGGRDPGAMHHQLSEKDIVFDVSQRLVARLNKEPGVKAHLTRERDVLMNLTKRVRKAEAVAADIFISIHVNGCPAQSARGAEVFYLSLKGADDVETRELATLENQARAEGEDPLLGEIAELPFAVDLIQTDTLRRSSLLAEAILDALCSEGLGASRGVKQANFVVLRSCRVPSALVELGFLSNPADAKNLKSAQHRQLLADKIAAGLLEYRGRYARHAQETG